MRMSEDEEDSCLQQYCEILHSADSAVDDTELPGSDDANARICNERKDGVRLPRIGSNPETETSVLQPRPPSAPRLSKSSKSVDETMRARRIRNSQESLSDPAETGSSTDSLREDRPTARGGLIHGQNHQACAGRRFSATASASPTSQDDGGESDYEQQDDLIQHRPRSSRVRLSPVQPAGTLPALERNFTPAALTAANLIARNFLEHRTSSREILHRNLSDSRLLESMGFDSASISSLRSTYSVLSPIRPQDVRNRSFLEGSVLGSGALLGAEELDRCFPDRRVGIYIATWNMQGEKGLPGNLDDLLLPTDSEFAQDFYIIGVQEGCPDRREWENRLQETLGPYYVMLYAASHGVLYLSVFVRRDLMWFCSEVEHATVTTRIISQIKTKGAVGVALIFFGTSFLFITSHFTSGDAKVYERILDYNKIIEALALPKGLPDTNPYRSTPSDVTTRFDQVFWFGDFNFRLNKDRAEVENILRQTVGDDMSPLLQHDQLAKEMKEGSIFKGFQEAPVQFRPTYKFDIGCDVYDTTAKQRTPSYTDRILFRNRQLDDIKVVKYTSCSNIKTSDHRPVIGVFQVRVRPGRDNIPLCGGQFDRSLYLEGIRRRMTREMKRREAMKNQSSSTICSIS